MIRESGISKQDQQSNPQAILDAIGFMNDAQQMNEEDHAFSKFANFGNVYAGQLQDPNNVSADASTSPKTSPSLPKRPISPSKPRRKASEGSKGDLSGSSSKISSNVVEPPPRPSVSHSSSFSKIPQAKPSLAPKPSIPSSSSFSTSQFSNSSSSLNKPAVAPKPSIVNTPIVNTTSIVTNPSSVPKPAPPSRPPVPSRPAHTLGIASTDVKPGNLPLFNHSILFVAISSIQARIEKIEKTTSNIPPPQPPKPVPPKPYAAAALNDKPSSPGHQKIRPRPRAPTTTDEVIQRLQEICNPADPTKLYKDLVKIGQGASGGVYTAKTIETGESVAIKQMNLEEQPKKDLIINEIIVMKSAKHKNIVNFIDSFLVKNDLWVFMIVIWGLLL